MKQAIDLKSLGKIISLFVLLAVVYLDATYDNYQASSVVYIIVGLIAGADVRDVLSQYITPAKKDKE